MNHPIDELDRQIRELRESIRHFSRRLAAVELEMTARETGHPMPDDVAFDPPERHRCADR